MTHAGCYGIKIHCAVIPAQLLQVKTPSESVKP